MEASQAVGGSNRRQSRWGDAEEIEDEQRERELKNKLNQEFKAFVKKLDELVRTTSYSTNSTARCQFGIRYPLQRARILGCTLL